MKSIWIAATSIGLPVGLANGMTAGERAAAAARATDPSRDPSGRSPEAASASEAAAKATTNVTPNTPATTARRTVIGFETCDTPREPQVNPPSGQSPRSQSTAVHTAAAPRAVSRGRPGLPTRGNAAPNSATDSAASSVRAPHASVPKSITHDSERPNPVSP
jgi:hypothetical protein